MKQKLGLDSEAFVGKTGDFEVTLDGRPVFSKQAIHRFPSPGEVEDLMRQLLSEEKK